MKKVQLGKTFGEKVVDLAKRIPAGRVVTYGDLAKVAGGGGQAARSVNGILVKADRNGVKGIPFHRIVYAGGRVWLGNNPDERLAIYKKEKIDIDRRGMIVNFAEVHLTRDNR